MIFDSMILDINLPGKITWQSRPPSAMSRAGPFEALHRACLSARACPTATHIVVTSACAWERESERVWAPVTVVIVVNLTTVKAVTACPYTSQFTRSSPGRWAQRKILLSKSRSDLRFRVGRVISGVTLQYCVPRKFGRRGRGKSAWRIDSVD